MTHEELEKMVLSHEKALLIVADTEGKALEMYRIALMLAMAGVGLAVTALFASLGVFA